MNPHAQALPATTGFRDPEWLDLIERLLEALRGRMSVIQPLNERYHLAATTLESLYKQDTAGRFPPLIGEESTRQFLDAFLSSDLIDEFLDDPTIEDIMVNATEPIFVHRTGQGLVKTAKQFATAREVAIFVKKLIIFGGRSEIDPINDVELFNVRGRVNIIQSPFGPQITITRGKPAPFSILQLIETGMLTYELAAQLWLYVEACASGQPTS